MPSERDLTKLLGEMRPSLDPREYLICRVRDGVDGLSPLMSFREDEGITVVIERQAAESSQLETGYRCRRITLSVHSDLHAVGFLANVTQELAKHGVSVNVVSAFYHDHLFVPPERAEEAMRILEGLSARSSGRRV